MKDLLILILTILIVACKNDSNPIPQPPNEDENQIVEILLLQVDYETLAFEGGIELEVDLPETTTDTLPIIADFESTGDLGSHSLFYSNRENLIFSGTTIWSGNGTISYPNTFDSPDQFPLLSEPINLPEESRFQIIRYEPQNLDYESIWGAINELKITWTYYHKNKPIGLFLYTPSIGPGDPTNWKWFVIMGK